jgi:uncharacterized protein
VRNSLVLGGTLAFALAVLGTGPASAQKKVPDGKAVLLLSGGQREHHGYRDQAFYLAGALEDTGRFRVTIVEDAAILETPALDKYDLVILTADRRDPEFKFTGPQQDALVSYVERGHGFIAIHGADNAAPDWSPELRKMLGGVFSHVGLPDSKTRKGTYTIEIVDTSHPITKGLTEFEIKDELYYHLQMQPGVEPLATTEHEGEDWPVAWAIPYGKGRVFHTPLGHRDFGPGKDDPLRHPSLTKLIIQGADWAAEASGRASEKGGAR